MTDIKIKTEYVQHQASKTEPSAGRSIFKNISKPQVISNLVNNVFKPMGCKLVKCAARPLRFSVQCSSVANLEKTRERSEDGTLARELKDVLLTEEIIKDGNPSNLCFKTEMDEETYQMAHRTFLESGVYDL